MANVVQALRARPGAHNVSGLRQILEVKFRSGEWQQYMEDLEVCTGKVASWERTSGESLSDGKRS